jgi:CheY-like chemotaxis protein
MSDNGTNNRILIVDDEEEILELLGEYLKMRGYHVVTAYDGGDGLDIVRSGNVDLVITDVNMPGMDGLAMLDAIRELPVPVGVVVMTGYATVETAIRAMKDGAYDYLLKPFKLRDLHTVLVRAMERLIIERDRDRMSELLKFHELVHSLEGSHGLARVFGLGAMVAMRETGAAEVALWVEGPDGWAAVARGGEVIALGGVEPQSEVAARLEGEVAIVPIRVEGRRRGVLGVAGGVPRVDAHVARLEVLTNVLAIAIATGDRAAAEGG